MRWVVSVAGVAVLLVGVLLLWVPLAPQPAPTLSSGPLPPSPGYVFSVGGYSLTGTIPVTIYWTMSGGTTVTLAAAACSNRCNSGNVSALSGLSIETGTTGTFTIDQPNGGEIVVVMVSFSSPSDSVGVALSIMVGIPTVGSILLIGGIALVILGVVLPSGRRPVSTPSVPPPTPVQDTTNPSSPPPPSV